MRSLATFTVNHLRQPLFWNSRIPQPSTCLILVICGAIYHFISIFSDDRYTALDVANEMTSTSSSFHFIHEGATYLQITDDEDSKHGGQSGITAWMKACLSYWAEGGEKGTLLNRFVYSYRSTSRPFQQHSLPSSYPRFTYLHYVRSRPPTQTSHLFTVTKEPPSRYTRSLHG